MTVLPLAARSLRVSITDVAVKESRPVVGSSKKMRLGSVMSSTPMDVLFLSPPETPFTRGPPILVFWHLFNLNSVTISSTLYIFSSSVPLSLSLAANSRHSLTENVWNKISSY